MDSFIQERQQFYRQLDEFWHDLYQTEYALYDIKTISKTLMGDIKQATERIGHIFYKTANLLRNLDDDTLLQLGFPKETLSFIRLQTIAIESVIARLDLVVLDNKIKLLEINSDTPTFIKEAFYVNGKVCEEFRLDNPNEGCEDQLRNALKKAIQLAALSIGKKEHAHVVFSSHGDHDEDCYTTHYLKRLIEMNSEFTSLSELRVVEKNVYENGQLVLQRGLYDNQGRKVDILYRQTYPIEHLIDDIDPISKDKVGQILLQFVKNQELAILNPPSAFLLQSKSIMALIWGLYELENSFYNAEELEWIGQYFLPTYLDEDVFIGQKCFVKKPSFGREGDTVEIYSATGEKVDKTPLQTYLDTLPIYQEFITLPTTSVKTERGMKEVHYMYGSFLVNGEASAFAIRAGGQITDNESYFLPVGIEKEGDE
ncbi:glutathionylspermidine synthase family protein [Lysinibacillus sp. BW-2-10]|uniref:glutathionylspermidine synthase family protein n=1 Tax=Lysinibacillus sp. BW-2-10 TaxID=2590030 RepID=UPI00117FA6AF|nr:glutathionylspermidine synthase family protein [Lysinibacillus sp. BW-2-10]TSI08722.1 glutathionylspermidine synthase family protein [Lysinibacillus sp. BW-2-10]